MEVYGIKPIDSAVAYGATQAAAQTDQSARQTDQSSRQTDDRQDQGSVTENSQGQKELNREKLNEVTDEMNSVMQTLNTSIQFKLHEKTNELMVQVIDNKNGQVLKEFPPHELLDTMAKIKDCVGALVDKKV